MTDAEKLALINRIVNVQIDNNDDDGDKYLGNTDYAMEAITAVLDGETNNSMLGMFREASE